MEIENIPQPEIHKYLTSRYEQRLKEKRWFFCQRETAKGFFAGASSWRQK